MFQPTWCDQSIHNAERLHWVINVYEHDNDKYSAIDSLYRTPWSGYKIFKQSLHQSTDLFYDRLSQ